MSAVLSESTQVYHCIYCGPCMALMVEDESRIIIHNDVIHPDAYVVGEEDNPQ